MRNDRAFEEMAFDYARFLGLLENATQSEEHEMYRARLT